MSPPNPPRNGAHTLSQALWDWDFFFTLHCDIGSRAPEQGFDEDISDRESP
jgi:hypothetical protein